MNLFNTLTRAKEEFHPLKEGAVSMYHCGPTVYDYAHIGNFRAYLLADLLRRVFLRKGFAVDQVMNITDVDDKTIARAREEGKPLQELTNRYTALFLEDLRALRIVAPAKLIKATEHIPQMVALVEKLLAEGYAYTSDDGSVYFRIAKSENYGTLAGLSHESRKEGVRMREDEYAKEDAQDFVLWKAWDERDGPIFWETSLGKGRPGWHIECSAMSMEALGETFDIHTGGIDLIFPHHTNEIAQSEAATGKPFVRFWLHNEFITVDGEKMSKSKKNIFTLADLARKGFDPLAYRYWLLTAHYRSSVNFTWDALKGAETALRRLREMQSAPLLPRGKEREGIANQEYLDRFMAFIEDDLDTPKALALVHEMFKDAAVSFEDKKATFSSMDSVLGIGGEGRPSVDVPEETRALVAEREAARANKEWKKADALRGEIKSRGYDIKDTSDGPLLYPLPPAF